MWSASTGSQRRWKTWWIMTDPMTGPRLDAIEQRLGKPRLGRSIARETDLDLLAIRRLLAEVRRLRAMEQRVREYARHLARPFADGVPDREGEQIASELLVALGGGE